MADARVSVDLFANDRASAGFAAAGRSAQAASDDVMKLGIRLDEIGTKSAKARVGLAGDKEATAALDKFDLKLLDTGRKVVDPKITLDGAARAAAEISSLDVALDRLSAKHATPSVSVSTPNAFQRGIGSLVGVPGGGGGAGGAGGGGGALAGGVPGIAVGIAAAVPAVEALLVEVTGLVTGLTAAGLGVGAFGALALPTFLKVKNAYAGITAAQQAYTAAQQLEKEDPTKAHALAAELALDKLKIAEKDQPPLVLGIISGIKGLVAQFDAMAKVMQPDILKTFNLGLKLASQLLPALLPLAKAAAPAIEGLLKQMTGFFQLTTTSAPPGWKPGEQLVKTLTPFGEFMKTMTSLVGPSITAIGDGLGRVGVAFGKLLEVMSKKDVIHSINIAFDVLVIAIEAVTFVVSHLMHSWDELSDKFRTVRHDLAATGDQIRVFFAAWASTIAGNFSDFRHRTAVVFDGIRGDIAHYWDMTWNNSVARISRGIGDAATDFSDFRHRTAVVFDGIRADIANIWNTIWANTIGRIQRGAADAVSWFAGLPRRLVAALSGLGNQLNSFAANALHLFLEGFMHEAGNILSWVGNFAKGILGKLGSLFGIHSPSSVMYDMGKNLVLGLEKGIKDHAHKAATALAGATVPNVGSGVSRWTGVVQQALAMEGLSQGLTRQVLYQIGTESGGNPNAINLTDINAQMGDPSRGLLQTIMATFQAYHWPGTSLNIYDPLANVAAAINYARHVYGPGLMSGGSGLGSGHGYDTGGLLPPGLSLALNTTGRAEVVAPGGMGAVEARLGQLVSLVDELCNLAAAGNDLTAAAPARTGAGLGAALAGGARAATYRQLYS